MEEICALPFIVPAYVKRNTSHLLIRILRFHYYYFIIYLYMKVYREFLKI